MDRATLTRRSLRETRRGDYDVLWMERKPETYARRFAISALSRAARCGLSQCPPRVLFCEMAFM